MSTSARMTTTVENGLKTDGDRKRKRRGRPGDSPYRKSREAVWLLLPAVVALVALVGYPIFFLVRLSFSDWTGAGSKMQWVGLTNYKYELLHNPDFRYSVIVTLVFVLVAVTAEMLIGFALALLVQEIRRGKGVIRTLFLVPMVMTPIVAALVWKTLIYDATAGLGTYLLSLIGHGPISWLGSSSLALPSVIATEVWHWTPLVMLILLAGLVSLPRELYEAARVDGAGRWQTLRHVTLPLMVPVISIALAFRAIDAFRTFDVIFALTGGGPGTSTLTLPLLVYQTGFQFFQMGNGAATSVMFILLSILVVSLLLFGVGRFRRTR